LDGFELGGRESCVADAVGGNLKTILGKGDQPAYQNHQKYRFIFEFQVAVPREGHKDVRDRQQQNRFHGAKAFPAV
jgi:hypothetical protein